mmetsp:Transcript_27237/g.44360  ORF Transcript_27237/g.44360 Transcript_27237/m.44360 type:complete len:111 (+) Transcript_27237:153-485(+)
MGGNKSIYKCWIWSEHNEEEKIKSRPSFNKAPRAITNTKAPLGCSKRKNSSSICISNTFSQHSPEARHPTTKKLEECIAVHLGASIRRGCSRHLQNRKHHPIPLRHRSVS